MLHKGILGLHIALPCVFIRYGRFFQYLLGTKDVISFSILDGCLLLVQPSLYETLATFVSTGIPSTLPKALIRIVLAVFLPIPGKARRGGVFFVTSGTVQDDNGTLYRANLRGLLIDASEQGLVYKVDGRIHNTDRTNADQDYLFANLHYLAIVKAVA